MSVDFTDSGLVQQTTLASPAATFIVSVVPDDNGDIPFDLAEGDTIQIIKTANGDSAPTLNDGVELASGVVPAGKVWTVTISTNITEKNA